MLGEAERQHRQHGRLPESAALARADGAHGRQPASPRTSSSGFAPSPASWTPGRSRSQHGDDDEPPDWPEPVRRVAEALRDGRVEARMEEFARGDADRRRRRAGDRRADRPDRQVARLRLRRAPARRHGPGRRAAPTPSRIAAVAGCERVKPVGADAVEQLTGFPPGGVAPFPLPGIETVLDRPGPARPRGRLDRRGLAPAHGGSRPERPCAPVAGTSCPTHRRVTFDP